MNKNLKFLFLSLTFILLIVSVGAISATDVDNSTTDTFINSIEKNVKDVEITKYSDNNNLLTENQVVNYYISDSNGNDNNTGTKESPYKTIQTAIDKTTSESTYNIHILEGTYKGLRNTNLTVNGNYNINFIGDGINKTIIDGEVNYTIIGASVWGQDDYWDYYSLTYGNWGMNITEGNGHITLSNMNFQHMLTTAEQTRIEYNYLGTVTNYANLTVDNVLFYQNLGGLGAGIQNKANATLYVNNSIFQENRKSSGTGNFGAGVYNNGTAIIENSQFIKNAARWGTITNDNIITVNNCTLQDGISYNLSSTYKYGSGFAYNTGKADYFNPYDCPTSNIITNCTFIRNDGTDIYANNGNLTVTCSQFINSTRIALGDNSNNYSISIKNNTFINPGYSSQDVSLSTTAELYAIRSSIMYCNLTIEDNKFQMINGTALSVFGANIKNNNITFLKNGTAIVLQSSNTITNIINNTITGGYIDLRSQNTNISNNTITTKDTACIIFNNNNAMNNIIENNTLISSNSTYAVTLYNRAHDNNIKNNYMETCSFVGDNAVLLSRGYNTVINNKPEAPTDGIFVNATATNIGEGTLTNPTTLTDALSKITNEKNKIYLINATGEFKLNNPINIDSTTVNTNKIIITGYKHATISGSNISQIMNIKDGYTITISNITFKDALADYGAIIYTEGNLTVLNSEFENSNANIAGGAIYANNNAVINLTNNTFNNIKSNNETIFLNATSTITNKNNKYNNCSINLKNFNITSDTKNPTPIKVNDTVKFNVSPIILENPNFYDSDITNNVTYIVFKDDEIINQTSDNSYTIIPINPKTFTTYVQPNFTNQLSNTISTDVNYPYPKKVTIYSDDLLVWTNENITIKSTLIDEFDLEVERGTITYFNQTTQIGTSEVQNGTSTFTLNIPTEGINKITLQYNDPTTNYTNATHTINLTTYENIYVNPNITEPATGFSTDPTTINDALTKIRDNQKIILQEGIYNINETITITAQTTNATNFTIAGENNNVILNGQNETGIITSNRHIIIENLTFINGNSGIDGGSIYNGGTLTVNNSKFINSYASQYGSAICSEGVLIIDNCEFINNTGDSSSIVRTRKANIYNSKFIDNTAQSPVIYTFRNDLTIINTTFDNNNCQSAIIYVEGVNYGNIVSSTRYLVLNDCNITNNQVNSAGNLQTGFMSNGAGILKTTGFISTTLNKNLFENDTTTGNAAINLQVFDLNTALVNNTFKNIKTTEETNRLTGNTPSLNGNTYENCTIQFNCNLSLASDTNIPIKIGDSVNILVKDISLVHPTCYDSNILDDYTYNTYMNNQEIQQGIEETSYTVNPTVAGDVSTNIKPSFTNINSEDFIFDVQDGDLKNVVIKTDNKQYLFNQSSDITVLVTDKSGNSVDNGIITMYYENNTEIGSTSVTSGTATITIPKLDKIGNIPIIIKYNTNETYNNQTNTIALIVVSSDVYASPDVVEAKEGTFDYPTTIEDALTKVANNGTIHLLNGTDGTYHLESTIELIEGLVEGTTTITIKGEAENIILDGNEEVRIFSLTTTDSESYTITLQNLKFTNVGDNDKGGVLYNRYVNCIIKNCTFENTYISGMGSAIFNEYGNVIIISSNFTQNTAECGGGAICNMMGSVTIDNCNFDNYLSYENGEAIYNSEGTVLINNSKFYNAENECGSIYNEVGDIKIENSLFENINSMGIEIYNDVGSLIIENITFNNINNFEYIIANFFGMMDIQNSTFENITTNTGSPIYIMDEENTLNIINNTFKNITANSGGVLYLEIGSVTFMNNKMTNVKASDETIYGGDGALELSGNTYTNCTIGISDLTIEQDSELTDLKVGDNVTIIINEIELINPDWYDADILDDMSYEVYTNDTLNSETEETTATVTMKSAGVVDVYAKTNFGNAISNVITFNVTQYEAILTVDPVVAEVGDLVKLTARLSDENGNPINEGKVIFKVGGSTIKDENGKPIYGYVKNGVATIETTVQKGWTKENTIISTTYSGNNKFTSAKANNTVNVTYRTASIQILNDKSEYQSGSTIQLTAIVKDNHNRVVEDGIVLFKLNGVTLKDENGKAITATVSNGIAQITYSLGTLSVKNYTVTAVLSNKNFNKAEANSTFVILKGNIHVEVDAVRVTNNTSAVLTGKVFDGNNNVLQRPVKVAVKINGITFATKVTVNNGTINIPLNESVSGSTSIDNFKMNRLYNILIIIGENNQYNGCNATTILIKQ